MRFVFDDVVQGLERGAHETGEAEARRFAHLGRVPAVGGADSASTNGGAATGQARARRMGAAPRGPIRRRQALTAHGCRRLRGRPDSRMLG
jgi:hypothetical protein